MTIFIVESDSKYGLVSEIEKKVHGYKAIEVELSYAVYSVPDFSRGTSRNDDVKIVYSCLIKVEQR
jgi:hypothetical protein